MKYIIKCVESPNKVGAYYNVYRRKWWGGKKFIGYAFGGMVAAEKVIKQDLFKNDVRYDFVNHRMPENNKTNCKFN